MPGPRALLAPLALLALLALTRDAPAGDPRREWKTIESAHFVVHYYEPLGDVARRVAGGAAPAPQTRAPGFEPEEKTVVVLVDDTDGANGFASVLPRNAITLYATAPGGSSALNDHDDWLYGLTAHEYAHILHLDSITGLPRLYNKIFGKTWAPNQIQPRWIIEGIATYQESKRSSSGRLRNSTFEAYLRGAVLDDQELRLDEVTSSPDRFPRGNAAYLYGSAFLEFIFDRYGDDKLRAMSWAYASSPIPFGLNKAIEAATGETFVDLYDEWRVHMRREFELQREAVERRGLREGRQLTFAAETNISATVSRDGRYVVWEQADGLSASRLRALPIDGNVGDAWDHVRLERVGAFDLTSDGSVVFEQARTFRGEYSFQDLVLWDRASGRETVLTEGQRARDPAVSPDDRRVAFSWNGESRSRLAVIDLAPEAEPRVLWEGERFDQVYAPAWSPDGARLAFSAWRRGGRRDIGIVAVETGAVTWVQDDRALDTDPAWSPDGRWLYYTSDRTGIYNVYALDLESDTGATWQVTNVLGGTYEPSVSPDGKTMVYHAFTREGYDLFALELDPAQWLAPLPYVDDRPAPTAIDDDAHAVSAPRAYRALESLAPQAYSFGMATSSFGSAVTAQTVGADAAGLHAYSVAATVGLEQGHLSAGASYAYGGLWPSLRLSVARSASQRSGLRIDGVNTTYTEDTVGLSASLGLPVLRRPEASGSISIDYDLDWQRNTDDEYTGPDPNEAVPRFPETDAVQSGLALRATFSDTRTFGFSLGPQEGRDLSASVRFDHPALGSDFRGLSLAWTARTYWRLPWGTTPTLAVRYAGGMRSTDQSRSSGFSLGGVPEQNIVDSIIQSARAGSTGYLRGYPLREYVGTQFHLLNVEYRHELYNLEHGVATLPIYLRRIHVAGLFDLGDAFSGEFELGRLKPSLGGPLRRDATFGYFVGGSFEIGYARGLVEEGIDEYWLLLTGTL
jgi:Tol biopolymer transport system component